MEDKKPTTPPTTQQEKNTPRQAFQNLFHAIRDWFDDFMDLRDGLDQEGTIISIRNNKKMRGSNAWMLICSIMIASLGLNLNSPAVIIGAMLISPLMSPILGVGLAVGTNDREALVLSLRHFGIAILIALITSTLYFAITPLDQFTDEMRARTAPTFFDALVAVFGGLAGIISVTRKDKSNAIPGVAIATALMPPLCVTGYGIAAGDVDVAFNSFYLFFLNSFFIALTTYLIIRLLQFPYRAYVNAAEARKTRIRVTVFSLLIIVPGILIFRNVIKDLSREQNIRAFVVENFPKDCMDYRLFQPEPSPQDARTSFWEQLSKLFVLRKLPPKDSSTLVLQMLERTVPEDSFLHYENVMREQYNIDYTHFRAIPDYSIELANFDRRVQGQLSGKLNEVIDSLQLVQTSQLTEAVRVRKQLEKLRSDSSLFSNMVTDAKVLYEELEYLSIVRNQFTDTTDQKQAVPIALVSWNNRTPNRTKTEYEGRLLTYIKQKAKFDTLVIMRKAN
ncbi:MAG: DUF389 domain-containing protein [Saprospiraceae bacterium]|nr:DUF389 domain-containing protein [Saprospiraceae bacterium]